MSNIKVGLVGIVHEEAKCDFWGTMRNVAAIGYQGIEGVEQLLEGDAVANVQRFHELGLQVISFATNTAQLRDDLDTVIARGHALQSPYVSVYWTPCTSRDEILRDAELFNAAGAQLAEAGIRLCYHNHDQEFTNRFNGLYALDLLAEYTDPQALAFELDIAWVTVGGEDPVHMIRKFAGRVPIIHVKDLRSLTDREHLFTAVGTGLVKVRESLQTAIDTGVIWAVIEQDTLRNLTSFETATVSFLNLKETGLLS